VDTYLGFIPSGRFDWIFGVVEIVVKEKEDFSGTARFLVGLLAAWTVQAAFLLMADARSRSIRL
jgi:hypothetical protein